MDPGSRAWRISQPPVSPARAGMDPQIVIGALRINGFPRTRGDGPADRDRGAPDRERFPPHARGWTWGRSGSRRYLVRAGMDMHESACFPSFPRTRGDGPKSGSGGRVPRRMFPPHARGWTLERLRTHNGFPRTHGPCSLRCLSGLRSFPRTRGDGPRSHRSDRRCSRFPPHARGWTFVPGRGPVQVAVSPARAGMDRLAATSSG